MRSTESRRGKPLYRRPEIILFAMVLGAYAYFYQAGGWNQNSRFDLVRSMVERHSVAIDALHGNTGDEAKRGDHYYCDKAPGTSWLALPAYAVLYRVMGPADRDRRTLASASYISTITAVAIPSAMGSVAFFLLLEPFAVAAITRAALSLAYAFGTLAFPYSTLFYGHQLAAALTLIGFTILVRMHHLGTPGSHTIPLLATGALLGLAVGVEYQAALSVLVIMAYTAVWGRSVRRLLVICLGASLPALALFLYHTAAFGGPFRLPYAFSTLPQRSMGLFMGIGAPDPQVLRSVLIHEYRGLFYSSPWLLFAIPGAIFLLQRRVYRAEVVSCLAIFAFFLWLNGSVVDWQGGRAMGPRYLIPAIPFLAVLTAGLPLEFSGHRRLQIAASALVGVAVLASMLMMLAGTAVQPEVSAYEMHPYKNFLLPAFWRGDLALNTQSMDSAEPIAGAAPEAWNWGQRMGLGGLASLIPLGTSECLLAAWLALALRAPAGECSQPLSIDAAG